MNTKIHRNENDQLLSIKGINHDDVSRKYLLELLNKVIVVAKNIVVRARRNNYKELSINKLNKKQNLFNIKNLYIDGDLFEISFTFTSDNSMHELLEILVDLWFCYEQPVFYFFSNEKLLDGSLDIFLNENLSWRDAINKSASYVIFKGAEEDVIWVGKSIDRDFNII